VVEGSTRFLPLRLGRRGWPKTTSLSAWYREAAHCSRSEEDADAALARARENGADVVEELRTYEYGERSGVVEDLAGHRWELT
jgi:uncharacterized glyoxalase superfamily protein PhnB